jgi:hypothetical protein
VFKDFFYKSSIWTSQAEQLHLHLMKMIANRLSIYVLLISALSTAQEQKEFAAPDYIKSVKFSSRENRGAFPVVALGDQINLLFDDLNADEADYYYRIKFYNHDWTPSQLFQNEYLEGYDNLRIENYRTSFNTLQSYTHYNLNIPNENVQLKVSGNYMIEIYSTYDELIFSRRFCVYEDRSTVQAAIYKPQHMDLFTTHQSVHFAVTPKSDFFVNPEENVNVAILQNYQWNDAITGVKPQYFSGNTLDYRYEGPTQFEGGNEYFFFDTKDLRLTTPNIHYTTRADLYESYLKTDIIRSQLDYTYAPDINGDFEIRNIMRSTDSNFDADYSLVYFSLAYPYELEQNEELYIYGSFNNFELNELNKLHFNPALEIYESVILLKQGFYNYKYVLKQNGVLIKNSISGSHSLTENDYLILVYHRNIGEQYDALVGVGKANSFELQN